MSRTQEEIVARIEAIASTDFFGFGRKVLLDALDFEHARPLLDPRATEAEWGPAAGPDTLLASARDYYTFALGKIRDHRGLSASRSVDKLTEYAWLLGRDDIVTAMGAAIYEQYGAPTVKAFASGFELAWPDECDEGCGA